MLPIGSTSTIFQPEQAIGFSVEYWDTAQTVLYQNTPSKGLKFDVRQPLDNGTFTLKADLVAGGTTASNIGSVFTDNAKSKAVITGGYTANGLQYVAGGAPGFHGVTTKGRFAYRYQLTLRSTTGRGWWSATATPTFILGFAGSCRVRVVKTVSGTPADVLFGSANYADLTEGGYLSGGPTYSVAISNVTVGDKLDIYVVSDREPWSGWVMKAILTGSTPTVAQWQDAPVICSGLFDDGTTPSTQTLQMITEVNVQRPIAGAVQSTFTVPLVNTTTSDGFGWQWIRSSDELGFLRQVTPAGTIDVKTGRLVRIKAGLDGDLRTLFVGMIDDFEEVSLGEGKAVSVMCKGFEQRMLDQFVKNFPDKISYMQYGYRLTSGTSEPVYATQAYDNWPIEFAVRDLMLRGGIDESRMSQVLQVPNSAGTATTVSY